MIFNDLTTLSILMEKKSGLLSQVVRTLVKRGHIPQGQQVADSDPPGHAVLSIYFKGDAKLGSQDMAALKNIHPAIREIKFNHPRAAAALNKKFGSERPIPEADFFAFLLQNYPNIVHLIIEYKETLAPQQRSKSLLSLGHNLGIKEYLTKYARGNPLALELTIKRMLQPALGALTPVQVEANSVYVENCPFCREYLSDDDCECSFLRGFILGFLKENPRYPAKEVRQLGSVTTGNNACHFEVH